MHENTVNGKRYIGITSQEPEKRWLNGYGYSGYLRFGRAIKKYGWDAFKHIILYENLSEEQAKDFEVALINEFQTQDENLGYNMTRGGEGVAGFHHTDESRKKMSEAKRGANHPNYGRHLSESTREKISQAQIGKPRKRGYKQSPEAVERAARAKWKPVEAYTDDGSFVRRFESAKSAEQATCISRKNISLCCLGHRKHAGGYSWKFAS
jgi:group I intron endonuclease